VSRARLLPSILMALPALAAPASAGCLDGSELLAQQAASAGADAAAGGRDVGGGRADASSSADMLSPPETSESVDLDFREVACEGAPRPLTTAPISEAGAPASEAPEAPRAPEPPPPEEPVAAACGAPVATSKPSTSADHIPDDQPLSWEDSPPSSGAHRARWARWGAYTYLSPARWLHNLEHGGVAILYDPCLPEADVATLRAWANARPDDEMGPFRWVLTPYPGLETPVALVAWEETLLLPCWRASDVEAALAFLATHYRTAPEDFPFDGGYDRGWLGR
jgi:hypothetical protein